MVQMPIKAARAYADLTQSELAKKVGISQKTLWSYENYLTFPSVDIADKICEACGLTRDQVKFLPDNPQNSDNEVNADADT